MFGDHRDINAWKNKLMVSDPVLAGRYPQSWKPPSQMELLWESLCGCQEQGLAYKWDFKSQQPGLGWEGQV